ncbi:MAG: 5-formyltetrahydrofolate cyclo-ligase [Bacteroidales bacterium]|nr:5-formyltetrahydrofolate cyclo-ligase [Bacteroidales bacterium]MCM1147001.1 5-formyltetrahydrofolate cyclo-ligase [Bacteroidales bacterium]MCM1205866.1 5-formyltetrahydrofolate cyclo-ligase [Bacillota bacterium]MCM1509893.1 5-formyltetrahydrofolate cyclo-ligase [Clostridium sp.]
MTKQELRNSIRKKRGEHSEEELAADSEAISRRLLHHPRIQSAEFIVAYWSLPDEPNIHKAIEVLHGQGKKVLLPCVINDTDMILRPYSGADKMQSGAFGIQEPYGKETDISVLQRHRSVILVPGVAFDRHGNRLGRGKGYYDRFLQKAGKPYTIGICHNFQIVDKVPCGEHDIPVNELA